MSGHDGDSYDALVVPCVWVPEGAAEPTEWLMQHPEAFRVPAMFDQDTSSTSAHPQRAAGSDRPDTMGEAGNAIAAADSSDGGVWQAPTNPRRRPSGYWLTATGARRTDPIAAYLQADEGLPRTAMPQTLTRDSAAESTTAPGASASEAPVPAAAESNPAMPDAAAQPSGAEGHDSTSEQDARPALPPKPGDPGAGACS
jgi:hypothetical protein